ncbi:GIY-YIG nuclease family protein [Aurantiacibacter gangjinensis]|uniref:GIY-YIG nuclease family protein n=1 Tax=Aurantiacibacter gangjinensis TaxID=502682 RepID=UPI00090ADB55|nr:GIY-YIG nuclease family protein [Aurantiacibacter gangjinensis]APE27140.1 Excinuclease ABC, C subunit-like [Aurantiacibacter gangjinensis]
MNRDIFQPAAYIMASQKGGTLYVGVTSDPVKRIHQHREGLVDGFTKRYRCKRLVWIEFHENMDSAIIREKQLKAGSRKTKIALIEADNADWRDLWDAIIK